MDVKDCYEALQEVIAAGLIDPDRVVVQGGSHGGIAPWPATHTALLATVLRQHRDHLPDIASSGSASCSCSRRVLLEQPKPACACCSYVRSLKPSAAGIAVTQRCM